MSGFQARRISQVAQFGDVSLDFRKMELCRGGQPVGITLREFKVLKFLISRPKVVVSRQRLISSAWPKRKRTSYRTVDNCIAKLRQKIERNPGCRYKFVPQEIA